jgi:hypothetical protein
MCKQLRCTICGIILDADAIPDDARQVTSGANRVFVFPNGEVHALVSTKIGRKRLAVTTSPSATKEKS